MKLQSITLENFGIYSQRTFEFGAAPVVLVYGQNESGKTTALNGIRQTLYGFPVRTPYLARPGMRGLATMTSRAGSQVEFSRKKARVDEVVAAVDASPVSPETLAHLLCNLTLEDYQSLFGFSLLELQRGEDALKTTPLAQALAGGGLDGMTRLEALQSSLSTSLAELYKSRGTTSPINVLLREIQQTKEALRQAQVLPSAVRQLQSEQAELQGRGAVLRAEQADAIRHRTQLQRFANAQPLCVRLRTLEAELKTVSIPDSVDARTVANWSEFNRQRQQLSAQEQELRDAAQRDQILLDRLGGHDELIGHAAAIQLLGNQAAAIAEKRSHRQQLAQQIAAAESHKKSLLGSLSLDEVSAELKSVTIAPHAQDELEQLSREFGKLSEQELTSKTRLATLQETSVGESSDALPLSEDELLQLESTLQNLIDSERELQRLEQLRRAQEDESSLRELHQKLASQLRPGASLDEDFCFPSQAHLEIIAEKHHAIEEELKAETRQQAKLDTEIADLRRRYEAALQPEDSELLREEQQLKEQRDAVMDQWLDELSQPLIAASIDAQQQKQRLEQLQAITESLDATQRRLLRSAQSIAERGYLEDTLQQRTDESATATRKIESLEAARKEAVENFVRTIEHLPIVIGPIDVMLRWTADFRVWQLQQGKATEAAKQAYIQQGVVSEFRAAVIDAWPTAVGHTFTSATLAQQLQRMQMQAQQFAENALRRRQTQQECASLTTQLNQVTSRKAEITTQYLTWLEQFPVPKDWPIHAAGRLVESLHRLQAEERTIHRCEQELASLDSEIEQFSASVQQLVASLPISLPAGLPEHHAQAMLDQLQSSQKDQEQRAKLSAALEHTRIRLGQVSQELRQVDDRLADICVTVGDQDPHAVQQTMQRIARAEQLRSELSEVRASLTVLASNDDLETFIQETLQSAASDAQLELHELQLKIDDLERQREECNRAIGVLTERFEQLSQNDMAAGLRQKLTQQQAELAELAQQWILFKTGHHILNRSIELFAEENEPELIRLARIFLSKLTGGRYVGVEHQRGKGGGFLVRSNDGIAITPSQLSSGTREQLYLALRMAYISHHCSQHEPLPVLMDDCFVNFDDNRMHHAIEAVGQWNDDIQTIIFSCHRRTRDAVEQLLPAAKVIDLQPQTATVLI